VSESPEAWRSLTAIERFMLRSEQAGGAMFFTGEVDFAGVIDEDVLERAVQIALASNPLLCCVVDRSQSPALWRTVSTENVFHSRRVVRLVKPYEEPLEPIDLEKSPGIRVVLTCDDGHQMRLVMHYHHACTDGQGAARFFLREVFNAYASLRKGESPKVGLDVKLLESRGRFLRPDGQPAIGIGEGLRNLWVTVRGKTARFKSIAKNAATEIPSSSVVVEVQLEDSLLHRVQELLRDRQVVLNDVALGAAFLMLAQAELDTSRSHYFSILNPAALRTWADRRLPAANRIGFAYVRRRAKDWTTARSLLESVSQQMDYVRSRGVAAELLKGIELIEKFPRILSFVEKSPRFTPTATLTCMSNLALGRRHGLSLDEAGWKLGDAYVRRVSATVPLPPGVPLAIIVVGYGDTMSVVMRGCRQYFDEALIRRLIENWIAGCEAICTYP